jgi:DNA repair protein RadC
VSLRDLAVGERPQERLERHGAAALSEIELLALLVRKGTRTHDVLAIAQQMLKAAGSLEGLLRWTEKDLQQIHGIGRVKAAQLITVLEVAKRVRQGSADAAPVFKTAADVFDHFALLTAGLSVEKFWVLCLNRKNRLLRQHEATSGTASSSLVHPREVFREAIRFGSSAVICLHNHLSGDPARAPPTSRSRDNCAMPRVRSTSTCSITSSSDARQPTRQGLGTIVFETQVCCESPCGATFVRVPWARSQRNPARGHVIHGLTLSREGGERISP